MAYVVLTDERYDRDIVRRGGELHTVRWRRAVVSVEAEHGRSTRERRSQCRLSVPTEIDDLGLVIRSVRLACISRITSLRRWAQKSSLRRRAAHGRPWSTAAQADYLVGDVVSLLISGG